MEMAFSGELLWGEAEDKDEIHVAKMVRRLADIVSLETGSVRLEFQGTSFCLGCGEHLNELLI